ncbi:MAG: T9SS type A sorting domain-containing protein [Ignavibacteriae bacterium]|nr:T9SS type A sorting domain-containing protein [Ignavibacteriota bacterium]
MKNLISALIIVSVLIPLCLLNANILNVPGSYSTIQSAINAAVNGDTILVAPGIYYENINFRGKGILLSSYYLNSHDTSYINNTIINGSTPLYPDSASCVIMTKPSISSAGDTTAALVGFTLTGGRGVVWNDIYFPGYLYREGGGIFIQNWSPRIRYNRILSNNIKDTLHPDGGGGGIRCCNGNPLIENNVIQYNFGYCGIAINFYHASGIIRNNIIAGNYGGTVWGGGAIYTYMNYLTNPILIENNAIINNIASTGCGGLRLYNANYITVKNNIVWGNLPSQFYVSGCTPSISYCDIQGGYTGVGNINLNPQFVSNSYYLNSTSPCIDAGDTSLSYRDPEDPLNPGLAMWPALGTLRNDMGVFGGPHCSIIGSSVIGIKNHGTNPIISNITLYQNYPNPFNPATNIKFQITNNRFVTLKVYDILGKEIAMLVNEKLQTGTYEIPFSINQYSNTQLTSGIYFYTLTTDNFKSTKKMMMIK